MISKKLQFKNSALNFSHFSNITSLKKTYSTRFMTYRGHTRKDIIITSLFKLGAKSRKLPNHEFGFNEKSRQNIRFLISIFFVKYLILFILCRKKPF